MNFKRHPVTFDLVVYCNNRLKQCYFIDCFSISLLLKFFELHLIFAKKGMPVFLLPTNLPRYALPHTQRPKQPPEIRLFFIFFRLNFMSMAFLVRETPTLQGNDIPPFDETLSVCRKASSYHPPFRRFLNKERV